LTGSGSEFTIDDLFKLTEGMSKKIQEFGSQKGMEEKVAQAMLNATDPDSRFKADIAMKLSTMISMMDMLVSYINKPVMKEGIMQRKLDGYVMIDEFPVAEGALVEFWQEEGWHLGKLSLDKKTKQSRIIDPVGNQVLVEKIEQLRARIRQGF
jgi:hypothetical protein